jgi:hypothetical protein
MTELARISPVTIERRHATAAVEEVLDAATNAGIPYTVSGGASPQQDHEIAATVAAIIQKTVVR